MCDVPPFETGMMWSIVAVSAPGWPWLVVVSVAGSPQMAQRPFCLWYRTVSLFFDFIVRVLADQGFRV